MNDFSQPVDRYLELVEATAGSDLALLFDTANNLALWDCPELVLVLIRNRVAAVHLADDSPGNPSATPGAVMDTGGASVQPGRDLRCLSSASRARMRSSAASARARSVSARSRSASARSRSLSE